MSIYKKLVVTASLSLSVVAIQSKSIEAATITYDFSVGVTTGALAGNSYDGSFSYDDSTLIGIGGETVGVEEKLSINFEFLGKTYTETDDNNFAFNFPQVEFKDGSLVGLQYLVTDVLNGSISSFAIFGDNPDGLGGGDKFSYVNENSVEVSEGSVIYSLKSPSTSVPEPNIVLGLGVIGFGWLYSKRQRVEGRRQEGKD